MQIPGDCTTAGKGKIFPEADMKRFIAGFVFLITGLALGAEESVIAVLEGSWPETGRVTEMELIHDLRGGAYVPYIADDEFRILRTLDGGPPEPYVPEGFDGNLLKARNLTVSIGGLEQYMAFIGRSGGSEAIYLFGHTFRDDLRYYPLSETSNAVISDYSLVLSPDGGVMIYTLAGGRLNCLSAGIGGDAPRILREISPGDEYVETFVVYRDWNQKTVSGWYRSGPDGNWEVTLFSMDEAGHLVREKTGPRTVLPQLYCRVSSGGKSTFIILSGNTVLVYHTDGGNFIRDLNFEAPFPVQYYSTALQTKGTTGLVIGETDTEEIFYAVTLEGSGAPALKSLFSLSAGELLDLIFTGDNSVSLVYRRDQTLRNVLIGRDGRIITEGPLPGLPPVPEEGSVLFYPDRLGENRFYTLICNGEDEFGRLFIFGFEQEHWNLLRELPVPRISPEEIWSDNRDKETLLLVSQDSLMLCETGSAAYQTMEMQSYARSIMLNGLIYLTVSSGNEIGLYRIEE
jgi:hypothetical protein